jgi:Tfp pilus assembly protein FimT
MHKQQGISFLELCIVLAIVSGLFFFSVQNYAFLQRKNTLETFKNQFITAIHYARMAALSRRDGVYLTHLPGLTNWASGMALFDAKDDSLLYQWHWQYKTLQGQWMGFRSRDRVQISSHMQQAGSNGRFTIRDLVTQEKISLVLNRLGRVQNGE